MMANWIKNIVWNNQGLLPVIVQDLKSNKILMFAWMNEESLKLSLKKKRAVYWSRSRNKLWIKGEDSGNYQTIKEMFLDCDNDSLLIKDIQEGGISCHTGRESCFYNHVNLTKNLIEVNDRVLRDPKEMYKKNE